ncbi:MAG: hypothetical protein V2A73_08615 [Pseudomonadota bacterium]
MAKLAATKINFSLNGVALEDELTSISQNLTQEGPVVTCFSDAGPRRVIGNYDWSYQLEGSWDGAASQGDATLLASVGAAAAQATVFQPTGAGPDTNDPNYVASDALLESYAISAGVGVPVTYSATLQGNSELERDVTP